MAYLYWLNRPTPHFIQTTNVSFSGKICAVRVPLATKTIGKTMEVAFRMATMSELEAWRTASEPLTMFGHQVIWADNNSLHAENEILGNDADPGVSSGICDYYRGTMRFIVLD